MERNARFKGFTLVEILIVLAIIVILAALLFPVFSRMREQGRATTCRSNLKQLALAVQLYAQDNNGRFVFSVTPELLASYIKSRELFVCPSQSHSGDPVYSYIRNGDLVDLSSFSYQGHLETHIQKPSITWLQTDMGDVVASPPVVIRPAQGQTCDFSTTWHSGGANYSFVDGHVKWMLPESACALYNESLSP